MRGAGSSKAIISGFLRLLQILPHQVLASPFLLPTLATGSMTFTTSLNLTQSSFQVVGKKVHDATYQPP